MDGERVRDWGELHKPWKPDDFLFGLLGHSASFDFAYWPFLRFFRFLGFVPVVKVFWTVRGLLRLPAAKRRPETPAPQDAHNRPQDVFWPL